MINHLIKIDGELFKIPLKVYNHLEQQKLRADRAEKRWEKLKEHFINEKEQSLGILSWSRNNGMLELMHDLEEDGE